MPSRGGRIYADPSIGTSPPRSSPIGTRKGITDDASRHILDADVRCGREIAAAFGCDVLLADSAPSELESMLDRFNGSARLRADPIDGVRHRLLSSPFGPRRELYSHLGTIAGSS